MSGQGGVICILQFKDVVISSFSSCTKSVDIKEVAILVDADSIFQRDTMPKGKSHCQLERIEDDRC